ncbi:MAG: hypothetical protein VX130_03025 [Verrucomicrobiota bacterium]|nr:hypothetical protein [Verrucomicrobiota bacterium]
MELIRYQEHDIRRWDVGPSTFLAAPEKGALLLNWHLNMSDGSVRDIIHWPEEPSGSELNGTHGGIPILFPFAGRSYSEGHEDRWRTPNGEEKSMPMHGFAKDASFAIRSIDQSGFEVEMLQTSEMKSLYPFDYTFTIIYHFHELTLQISLVLENEGRTPIPWSAGLHPYFQIPWRKNLSLSEHSLQISAKKKFLYREGGVLTQRNSAPNPQTLEDPELINSIFYELENPYAEVSLLNGEETIKISEVGGASVGSRLTFVTWTQPDLPFYCIEPWMSPPNSPGNQTTRMVAPAARDEFTIEIELA